MVFDGPPAELTGARVREIYGVTEDEFAERSGRRRRRRRRRRHVAVPA